MELQIVFCTLIAVFIASCQGLYVVGNVGGKAAATYTATGHLGYNSGGNDPGININGKAHADHYVDGNAGFGIQIGGNGDKGGYGLGAGVRSSVRGGAHVGAEASGNWYDKKIEAAGNIGADGTIDKVGTNIAVYYKTPDFDYNPWDHIGKYRKRRGAPIAKASTP